MELDPRLPKRVQISIGSMRSCALKSHSARATMKSMSVADLPPPETSNQSCVRPHS